MVIIYDVLTHEIGCKYKLADVIENFNVMWDQGYYDHPEFRDHYREEMGYEWAPSVLYKSTLVTGDGNHLCNIYFKDETILKHFLASLPIVFEHL